MVASPDFRDQIMSSVDPAHLAELPLAAGKFLFADGPAGLRAAAAWAGEVGPIFASGFMRGVNAPLGAYYFPSFGGEGVAGAARIVNGVRAGLADLAAEGRTAESLVTWVGEGGDLRLGENPGMPPLAYQFQSGTQGARSSFVTGRSLAPYLEFTDEAGEIIGAKFDGVQEMDLIDRKLNPYFSAKAVDQANRQGAVARY